MPGDDPSNHNAIVQLRPLPPVPAPPELAADPNQKSVRRVIGALSDAAEASGIHLASTNLTHGFHASRVDLRKLKEALEGGLRELPAAQVRLRWDRDVGAWVHSVLREWVQRTKLRRVYVTDADTVFVRLETQDDDGVYAYEFEARLSR